MIGNDLGVFGFWSVCNVIFILKFVIWGGVLMLLDEVDFCFVYLNDVIGVVEGVVCDECFKFGYFLCGLLICMCFC